MGPKQEVIKQEKSKIHICIQISRRLQLVAIQDKVHWNIYHGILQHEKHELLQTANLQLKSIKLEKSEKNNHILFS